MYQFAIDEKYDHKTFEKFLQDFLPDSFEPNNEPIFYNFSKVNGDGLSFILGECDELDLVVYEFQHTYTTDPRVGLTKEVAGYMKNTSACSNALVVFHNPNTKQWRLSLLTTDVEKTETGKLTRTYSNPKRFSFMLGEGCKKHTPQSMLFDKGSVKNFEDLKNRFAIDVVTEKFYKELFGWYEWAISLSKFPEGKGSNVDLNNKNNELNIIRLITRLMFVWFIKQKGLIPDWIFDEQAINNILVNFNSQSAKTGNYYNAIIQNLFFATLNRAINERAFAETVAYKRNEQYGINSFFRNDKDKSFFKVSDDRILELFRPVPFLNGGLFECLDKLDTRADGHNEQTYIDGFSREQTRRAFVPNILFWGKDKDEHEGLISLLNRYNFTVEENTPTEIEVALDPELLGKVFENLLGTYNPETRETARKDSGSFYTPREIVNFMVDETLKHYLLQSIEGISEAEISVLFSDSDEIPSFNEVKKESIVSALERIKILDPACGSGAFPMGCLQRIIQIENKLINDNDLYKRKLHLIKNCIYGIDIQPIAVQISKLRFFISLICEQKTNTNANDNYGIEPLPNLETKFVAANSLVGRKIDKHYNSSSLFENPEIEKTKKELQEVRSKHFDAKTSKDKKEYRRQDQILREKLVDLLVKEKHSNPDDAKLLVSWNPYDQNTASPFFDMEWMFGEKEGFDIVIGNPPYVQLSSIKELSKNLYKPQGYETYEATGDLYCLFIEKGLSLCQKGGSLTYITSNKWMRAGYGESLRGYLAKKNPVLLIDFGGTKIFDAATVDTDIIQVINEPNDGKTVACKVSLDNTNKYKLNNLSDFVKQNASLVEFTTSDSWVVLSDIEMSIKKKIEAAGVPLKDWDIQINYGIKTGLNDAFIINEEKRNEILSKCATTEEKERTEQIIRPILRGRDIGKYSYSWAGLYLICTFPSRHYNIDDYPALKEYLLSFDKRVLAQTGEKDIDGIKGKNARKKTNNKWFETQDSIKYWDELNNPKILYSEIVQDARFFFDENNKFLPEATVFSLTGKNLDYLYVCLNSSFYSWVFKTFYAGGGLGEHGYRYKKIFLQKLPISQDVSHIEKLRNIIINKRNEDILNEIFYNLYAFSSDEVAYIRRQINK